MMATPAMILSMPAEQYHAHPAISKTGLDKVAQSPRHYRWYKDNDTLDTKALVFGRAFHTMLLEPELIDRQVVIKPEKYQTKEECGRTIKEQKEEFEALHAGKAIISKDDLETAKSMAASIRDTASARFLLKGAGKIEPSLFWQDGETGVDCRARFDWLRDDGLIIDLKTTRCAKPEEFVKHAYSYRYHVQAAFYMEAYRAVTGNEAQGFAFIAVEKEPPYCACVFIADNAFIELGEIEYRKDIAAYADCLKSNQWPGYPDEKMVPLALPYWVEKKLNNGEYYNG